MAKISYTVKVVGSSPVMLGSYTFQPAIPQTIQVEQDGPEEQLLSSAVRLNQLVITAAADVAAANMPSSMPLINNVLYVNGNVSSYVYNGVLHTCTYDGLNRLQTITSGGTVRTLNYNPDGTFASLT